MARFRVSKLQVLDHYKRDSGEVDLYDRYDIFFVTFTTALDILSARYSHVNWPAGFETPRSSYVLESEDYVTYRMLVGHGRA